MTMTLKQFASKGGKTKSTRKAAAARRNWRKAVASGKLGRPKLVPDGKDGITTIK